MIAAAIRLSPADNVAVACRDLRPGEAVRVDGIDLAISEAVALGHKIAVVPLDRGDKVLKYGMPIGSTTAAVP